MQSFTKAQERAEELFNGGYNCCESVVLAVCEQLGVDSKEPLKVATPFGSGMSRNGSNCGALNAAFICVGMVNGRESNTGDRDASYIPADRIFNKFRDKYGSTFCKDITGINFRDPAEVEKNKPRLHQELCGPLVKQATQWILEELVK